MDTLWNIIRDFFVRFVFGGSDSLGVNYNGFVIGRGVDDTLNYYVLDTNTYYLSFNGFNDFNESSVNYFAMGDWLSTTATIITLVALFIGITMLTIKLFKFVSNAISMR